MVVSHRGERMAAQPHQRAALQDPNAALTRCVRSRRRLLRDATAEVLSNCDDLSRAQTSIRELESKHNDALRSDALRALSELRRAGRIRDVVFEEKDLGVSFVLARFDSVDGKHNELGRRFVVVETTRPLGVARRMLAPTDELVGIVGSEGLEPVVDPTVDAFDDLLKRLDHEERPLTLVFALGPQREAAHAAAVAAERETAKARELERKQRRAERRLQEAPKSPTESFMEEAFFGGEDEPPPVPPVERSRAWNATEDREEDAEAVKKALEAKRLQREAKAREEATKRASLLRQRAEADETRAIQRERDARRAARARSAADACAASSGRCAAIAQACVDEANDAAGGVALLSNLRSQLKTLRRQRIFDGAANTDFRRELVRVRRDLEQVLQRYGNNLTDKKGGEDDLEVIGRLLASGKDDFWDEDEEEPSETPPQSPNRALEKLRTRIASPKRSSAALRASKPPKFVHSPSKPATPHQSELDAAGDEFDEDLDRAINWEDDDDIREGVKKREKDDADLLNRRSEDLRRRFAAERALREDRARAADAAALAAETLLVNAAEQRAAEKREARRLLASAEAARRTRDRLAVARLRNEKERRIAARHAATAACELERIRRVRIDEDARAEEAAAFLERRIENITTVVALAEAERSRRVDERAALRIEAAAEQLSHRRSAIAFARAAKDAEVEAWHARRDVEERAARVDMVAERARSIALVCGSAEAERARRVELLVRADEAYRRELPRIRQRVVEACETERAERVAEVNRKRKAEVQRAVDARRDAARRCEEERQRLLENLAALAWRRPWAPAAIQRAAGDVEAFKKDAALWKRRFSDVKNSLTRDVDVARSEADRWKRACHDLKSRVQVVKKASEGEKALREEIQLWKRKHEALVASQALNAELVAANERGSARRRSAEAKQAAESGMWRAKHDELLASSDAIQAKLESERDAWKRRCSSLTSEMDGLRARRGGGAAKASEADSRELDELRASKASIEAERDAWKRRTDAGAADAARLRQRVAELETTVASASAAEAALAKERDAWKAQHDELNAPERTGATVRDLEDKLAAVRRECDMLKEAAPSKGPGLDVASALAISRAARSVGVAERRVRIADGKAAQALDAAAAADAASAALAADCLAAQGRAGKLQARLQSDRAAQRDAPPPDQDLLDELVAVKLQLAQASQLEEELASVRAQLAEARAGHDYIKPVEKAPKKKFFGRSKK
ncbi:unnamed protein product [Pelagomonas calceolata]|uniref:Uncharacterized protein n=1 Tax=Pelagomonas calceolata TaxID=35677 RepID=A0A8J2T168_9STRA|nr:unnamed protein product [Pelagomonas calceolata]